MQQPPGALPPTKIFFGGEPRHGNIVPWLEGPSQIKAFHIARGGAGVRGGGLSGIIMPKALEGFSIRWPHKIPAKVEFPGPRGIH